MATAEFSQFAGRLSAALSQHHLLGFDNNSAVILSPPLALFVVIHTVKGFGIVNKAEIDVFLELSCFFDDPTDVGNLISGSSAFSKSNMNI